MDFKGMLKSRKVEFEKLIDNYFETEKAPQKKIFEAMNYSLNAGGKRLRPILVLEACGLVNGNEKIAQDFACALEMIHTYSLIHDDLPAMDDDDLRRGKPTNHKVYGEGIAILAGDGLLNYAYEKMIQSSLKHPENAEQCLRAIGEVAKYSGVHGMIGGQVVDLESENKAVDIDTVDFIHKHKTAALIIGSMRCGAIIGGASEKELEIITTYAEKIGLAFQIVDDILDIVGDQEKLGKDIGSDQENHKSTYPSLLGLDESRSIARKLIKESKETIEHFGTKAEFLIELSDFLASRDH